MRNIVLARIDDRLIHGQVMTKWTQSKGFNHIVVVDNEVVKDLFICQIMKSVAPKQIVVDIMDIVCATKYLLEELNEREKICLLTKTPQTFESLLNGGVMIKDLILGGMGMKEGRTSFIRNAAASEEEKASLKRIIDKKINVFYQDVPETKAINLDGKL